ncbi:MAG: protein kinase [bacterium]|nr:protein kinase [bacterium]
MGTLTEGNTFKDRYKIIEVLQDQGDLAIYKAKDIASHNSLVYIREIDFETKGYKSFTEESVGQLVEMLSTVSHPALPKFLEYSRGISSGYIVEEYITGQTLSECLEAHAGLYTFDEAYGWMIELCDLIQYLHSLEKQIILRGITPNVIKITPSGALKVISLDKARYFSTGKETPDTVFVWNPGYTSPEQYGTQKSDVRADVYGFGAVFYYLFTKQNLGSFHFNFPPVSQFNPSFTKEQDDIFAKCLDKDVFSRYQSIFAVKNEIIKNGPMSKSKEPEVTSFFGDEAEEFEKPETKEKIKGFMDGIREWFRMLTKKMMEWMGET